jgi:hypothetical protein
VEEARKLGCQSLQTKCPVLPLAVPSPPDVSMIDWQAKGLQALAVHEGCLSHFLQ